MKDRKRRRFNVLLLSKYPRMGASSRLRSFQYLPFVESDEVRVTVSSLFDEYYLSKLYDEGRRPLLCLLLLYLNRLRAFVGFYRYDLIWVEYEIFPYLPSFAERILRYSSKKYIVDYDDAVFHNYDRSGNVFVRSFLRNKIDKVMCGAEVVVAGNNYIANRAIRAGAKKVEVIPTVIDVRRYKPKLHVNNSNLKIGWIGSPSTQCYVVAIRDVLAKVCELTGARVMLVGATDSISSELHNVPVDIVPWSEGRECELVSEMDVGIMPLVDGLWERGKCGYKLIQYMACGLPVVASPVGVNADIVEGSNSGYLPLTNLEWEEALLSLLGSVELRRYFGVRARRAVENKYCLQVQAQKLRSLIVNMGEG